MERLLVFALVGFVAQLIDGALGMAYGVTATTLLLSTGTTAAAASASVHLAKVGTGLASGLSHWRFGNVNWRIVAWIGVPGAVGAFAGATFLGHADNDWMQPVVAGILFVLGAYIVARFAFGVTRKPVPEHHVRGRFLGPLGLVGGFVDAVGGGGWGPVTTPTLMTAGRVEPRRAIGSVSVSEVLVALAASVGFLLSLGTEGVELGLTAALLVGGVAAAPIAAWLVRFLPAPVLGTAVGGLVLVTNTRTILLWAEVPGPARLAALVALTAAAAALVARSATRLRRPGRGGPGSPAPVDPLLEVGPLGADGGVVAVAGQDEGVGR